MKIRLSSPIIVFGPIIFAGPYNQIRGRFCPTIRVGSNNLSIIPDDDAEGPIFFASDNQLIKFFFCNYYLSITDYRNN